MSKLPSKKIFTLPPPSVKVVNSSAGPKMYFDSSLSKGFQKMLVGGKGGIMKNKQY